PKVIGERYSNASTTGEHGHGIAISSCKNVEIIGGYAQDCWGDGLYVGPFLDGVNVPECITVHDFRADNNRRQGLSVTGGKHLRFYDCQFLNTNGTLPGYGVDIEPNYSVSELEDIVFVNCVTDGNESKVG